MDWMSTVQQVTDDPVVRWLIRQGVRAIVRRVRRGHWSAAARSEAGPAPASAIERVEIRAVGSNRPNGS